MSFPKYKVRAFTIIELLVAITITAVMVTLMLTIVTNVLTAWNRSSGKLTVGNQARLLLDQITLDLQGAIIKRDGSPWLVATVQQDQITASGNSGMGTSDVFLPRWNPSSPLTYKPRGANSFDAAANRTDAANPSLNVAVADRGKLEQIRFGQAGVWLRFFSIPSDTNTALNNLTAPVAISYQLNRVHIGGSGAGRTTPITYLLFRSAVTAQNTFTAGYNLLGAVPYNTPNGTDGNAGTIRMPNANHVIANDVIDFGVRIYHRNAANELVEGFPAQRNATGGLVFEQTTAPYTYVGTSATTPVYSEFGGNAARTTSGIPEVVDVMVRILTPDGVRQMQAYEENPAAFGGASDAKWWELAEANSTVFTRRIELRTKAL